MGIMIALLSLVLLIVCIVFLLFCAYYHYVFNQIIRIQTGKEKKNDAEYNMVPCPEPTYMNAIPVPEPVYVNTADHDHDQ